MAAKSMSATSAALVEMSDPSQLSKLALEKGSAPLPARLFLKIVKTANRVIRRSDGTLNRRLADLMEYKKPASEVPDRHGVSSKDVVINTQAGLWVRIFLPPASFSTDCAAKMADGAACVPADKGTKRTKTPVIFHFHGGGFAVLSADGYFYDVFCRRLCRQSKAVVISVNYRRAPEHRYPTAYNDSYAALEWLEGFKGEMFAPHELDLSRCVLLGDSAGGNIVHHVGCRWATRNNTMTPAAPSILGSQQLKVVAHVLLFPFFGGEERTAAELRRNAPLVSMENTDWHWRAFLPPGATRDHPACNVFGPNAPELTSLPLPRSLVVIAEFDLLKDWQLRYAQGLVRAAKPVRLLYYSGGVHCFHVLSNNKLTSRMLSDIISFIKDVSDERIQSESTLEERLPIVTGTE